METVMATTTKPGRQKSAWRWPFVLGLVLLALALLALVYEAVMTGDGDYRVLAAGELWFRLHSYSLNLTQAIVQRYLAPALWDPVIVGLLQWPAWSILGAPGAVLAILFYPRQPRGG
ncbi:MAG: hypothetical protein ACR2RA_22200 [Geminicoccaceae bacterium]